MSIEKAKAILGRETFPMLDLENEGLFNPAIVLSNAAGRSVLGELSCSGDHRWVLWRIDIKDPRYQTAEGIRVGSSYKQLRHRKPQLRLTEEEGSRIVIDSANHVSFAIADGSLEAATVTELIVY